MYKLAIENNSRESEHYRSPMDCGWTHPLRAIVDWLAHEWRVQQTIKELRSFDDHMLKDIGLTRMEIESIVRHGRDCNELRRHGWL